MIELRGWVDDVPSLIGDVPNEARIGVSGFHFTRAPMAQLRALAVRKINNLHYIAWGGGLPLELLLAHDQVAKATLCFASLDVFGPAPRFRRAMESGSLELDEQTALGMINGFRAAGENLAFEVLQTPVGSSLTEGFSRPITDPYEMDGMPMSAVRPLPLDVLLLHAQRADDDGNVEIGGARGLDMSAIFAARRVLVTVEERVPRGELGAPRSFVVPRTFVTRLAVAPGGAYPTSCLPHYPADFRALRELVDADQDGAWPAAVITATPERLRQLSARVRVPAERISVAIKALRQAQGADKPSAQGTDKPSADGTHEQSGRGTHEQSGRDADAAAAGNGYTVDELMVAVLSRTIPEDGICSVGAASPLPTAAYLLAKQLRAPGLLLMSHNGGLVDPPVRPLSLASNEYLDFALAAAHTGGDETYHWYYQRGLITHEVVGSAQVDGSGATNNLWVTSPRGRRVRLPGQGGMADVANLHANFLIYLPRQSPRNTPAKIETVSAQRVWHSAEQRQRYGLRPGRTAMLSNLGYFEYDEATAGLVLCSLHPGVELDQVREQTGFDVWVADDLAVTEPPTVEELDTLRTIIDPLGVRRLDLVGAAERQKLLDELLDVEERLLDDLVTNGAP